jgi:glycerol-3-phosphate acyltransferase PlsY
MVGHAWPLFAGFRGGRSILTFAGGMCVLSPLAAAAAVVLSVAVSLTRSFASGARVGIFALPVLQLVLDSPHRTAATGALMSLIGLRFALAGRQRGRSRPATSDPAAPHPT